MDNYELMLRAAKRRFLEYDPAVLAKGPGVADEGQFLSTVFLGETVLVEKSTGEILFPKDGRAGTFSECLTVFDWLCDRKGYAAASDEFCSVSSLPGVLVRGSGLSMGAQTLAARIEKDPGAFEAACRAMGGERICLGDMGFRLNAFPDLPLELKFYRSDEEFPPSLTLLWNKNTLQFLRYETIYYLAACLVRRLEENMSLPQSRGNPRRFSDAHSRGAASE